MQTTTETMTREQLIATLAAAEPASGWYPTDETDGRYVDWSTTTADGRLLLEVGDDNGDVAQVKLSRDELVEVHRLLTIRLLGVA